MSSGDQMKQQAQGARPKTRQWNSHWNSAVSAQGFDCGQPPSSPSPPRHEHYPGPDPHTEYRAAIRSGRGRFPTISRGLSESSLVSSGLQQQQQPSKGHQRRHFHRRWQTSGGVRRGSSSADVSSFSSSSSINSMMQEPIQSQPLHGSNGHLSNNSHDSNGSGISVLLRWFRRRGNGSSRPKGAAGQPLSAQSSPVARRSRTPISISLERVNQLDSDASDTCLSAAGSFAYLSSAKDSLLVRRRTAGPPVAPPRASSGATLRRKYGLYLPSQSSAPEEPAVTDPTDPSGGAHIIRALRTQWESQMREAEFRTDPPNIQRQPSQNRGSFNSRKKRPAPPPPSTSAGSTSGSSSQPPSARNSLVSDQTTSSAGSKNPFYPFSHVPGKRRAPSPPSLERPPRLNIPPPPQPAPNPVPSSQPLPQPQPQEQASPQPPRPLHPPISGQLSQPCGSQHQQPQQTSPFSSLRRKKPAPRLPDVPPVDPKWNDLNSNLDGDTGSQKSLVLGYNDIKLLDPCHSQTMHSKAQLYDKKAAIPAQHRPPAADWDAAGGAAAAAASAAAAAPCNDILKLEHGILRPVAGSISSQASSASESSEQGRLTLPLKPWYKRHAGSRSGGAHALSPSSEKRKWKDPFNLEDWMPDVPYYRRSVFLHNSSTLKSPKSPLSGVTSAPVMRDTSRSASSSGSEKRRSLLANISELDREAAEIIQKEKEKEMMRKMVADAKFYSGPQADDASSVASSGSLAHSATSGASGASGSTDSPRTSARQLIHMFNSFNQTKVTVNPNFVADSPRQGSRTGSLRNEADAINSQESPSASQAQPSDSPRNFKSVTQIKAPDDDPPAAASAHKETQPAASASSSHSTPHASDSIFEPKFSLVNSSPKAQPKALPRSSITVSSDRSAHGYPGGARPKTTATNADANEPMWTCKVCTLLNKNIRLWCEVCSALRPPDCLPPDFQTPKTPGSKEPIGQQSTPADPQASRATGAKESAPKTTEFHALDVQAPKSAGSSPKVDGNRSDFQASKASGSKEPAAGNCDKAAADCQASKSAGSKESAPSVGLKTAEPKKWEEEIKKYFGAAPSVPGATSSAVPVAAAAAKNSNQSAGPAPVAPTTTPVVAKVQSSTVLERADQPPAQGHDVQGPVSFHPDPEALRQARLAFFSNRSGCSSPATVPESGTPPSTVARVAKVTAAVPVTTATSAAPPSVKGAPGTVSVPGKSSAGSGTVTVTSGNICVITKVTTGTAGTTTVPVSGCSTGVPAVNGVITASLPVVSRASGTTFVSVPVATVPSVSGTGSVTVSIVNGPQSAVPALNGGVSSVPIDNGTAASSMTGTTANVPDPAIDQVNHRPRVDERLFSDVFQETVKKSGSKSGPKVSSGCQTNADSLPKSKVDPIRTHPSPAPRKSRMTFQPMPCELFARKMEANVDHDDDVHSSAQLDNYVRQRKAQTCKPSAHLNGAPPADDGNSAEKRVEDLLFRLEEAISSGQFDKAAVLAKELAAIKAAEPKVTALPPKLSRSESLPAENRTPLNGVRKNPLQVNGRSPSMEPPAVHPRASHVTAVIQPPPKVNPPASAKTVVVVKESAPLPRIAENESKVVRATTAVVNAQPTAVKQPQQPQQQQQPPQQQQQQQPQAKVIQNGNPISKPSVKSATPVVNGTTVNGTTVNVNVVESGGIKVTVKNMETAPEAAVKVIAEPAAPAPAEPIKSPEIDSAIYGPSSSVSSVSVSSSSISQESRVSVKSKSKSKACKVDSEQQTAISYQRPVAAVKEEVKDPSFNVDVFIEDRLSQKGPFRVNVRPETTLGQLKSLMETKHQIDVKIQRWIIERRLATDEQQSLQLYGLSAENSSAFLYLVAPEPETPPVVEPEPPVVKEEPPVEERKLPPPPPFYHPRQYYNWEDDRYSICSTDESDIDMDNIDSGGVTTGTDEREDESSSQREDSDKQAILPTPAPPVDQAPQVPEAAVPADLEPPADPAEPEPPAAPPVAAATPVGLPDAPEVPAEVPEDDPVAEEDPPVDQVAPEVPPVDQTVPEVPPVAIQEPEPEPVPVAPTVPVDPPGPEAVAAVAAEVQEAAANAPQGPDGWICPQCTLLNPLNRPGCEACATNRPADVVLPAGMVDEVAAAAEKKPEAAPMTEDYQRLINIDQTDAVPNAEPFDCPVCLMTVPAGIGVTLRDCLHTFCKDCLAHVIEFSDDAVVGCPYRDDDYACDSTMQEREIKALVPPEIYEKHLARSMKLAEKQMKNAFHCQTPNCSGWCIIEDNVNNFRCPVCRHVNCLTCQAIHEGVNCKQYQDRVAEDAESNEDAKQTKLMIEALVASGEALSCPQCQVILMKRWGCDWVRCSVCRTEICWVTKQARWGPKGKGDTSGGCRCQVNGIKCHPLCNYCH